MYASTDSKASMIRLISTESAVPPKGWMFSENAVVFTSRWNGLPLELVLGIWNVGNANRYVGLSKNFILQKRSEHWIFAKRNASGCHMERNQLAQRESKCKRWRLHLGVFRKQRQVSCNSNSWLRNYSFYAVTRSRMWLVKTHIPENYLTVFLVFLVRV